MGLDNEKFIEVLKNHMRIKFTIKQCVYFLEQRGYNNTYASATGYLKRLAKAGVLEELKASDIGENNPKLKVYRLTKRSLAKFAKFQKDYAVNAKFNRKNGTSKAAKAVISKSKTGMTRKPWGTKIIGRPGETISRGVI